jgi:leucyl-tRNA synthetase
MQEPAQKLINQGMIQGMSMIVKRVHAIKTRIDSSSKTISKSEYLLVNSNLEFPEFWNEVGDNTKEKVILSSSTNYPVDFVKFENGKYVIDEEVVKLTGDSFPAYTDYRLATFEDIERIYASFPGQETPVTKGDIDVKSVEALIAVEKMSKSKYNVVTPDNIVVDYGADTLRLYEMFLGPLEQSKPWSTQGIEGVHRFLKKLWRLFFDAEGNVIVNKDAADKKELKSLHKLIKKVSDDVENFSFNTSVPAFMICVNELIELKCNKHEILEHVVICLSPYAPHIAEELWKTLGHTTSVVNSTYPEFKPELLVEDTFSYPISVNGKHRMNIEMSLTLPQTEVEQLVLANADVQKWLEGKTPKKIIFVKGKIVNMVV